MLNLKTILLRKQSRHRKKVLRRGSEERHETGMKTRPQRESPKGARRTPRNETEMRMSLLPSEERKRLQLRTMKKSLLGRKRRKFLMMKKKRFSQLPKNQRRKSRRMKKMNLQRKRRRESLKKKRKSQRNDQRKRRKLLL